MDRLATETLLQILAYLDGEDVGRFTRINKKFRNVIQKNRKYLKYPLVEIDIYNENDCDDTSKRHHTHIRILGKVNKWACTVGLSKKGEFKVSPWYDFYKDFYQLFPKDTIPNNLQGVFDLVLAKGDIASVLVADLCENSQIQMLSNALEATPSQIHNVFVCPEHHESFTEISTLLKVVGNHKRRTTARTTMEMHFYDGIQNSWSQLLKFNDLGAMFHDGTIKIGIDTLGDVLVTIAEKWMKCPFPKFNFKFRAEGKNLRGERYGRDHSFDVLEEDGALLVTKTNEKEFVRITKEDPESNIRVVEQRTGLAIQFEKKQLEFIDDRYLDPDDKESIDYVIKAFL